ncbi:hypothetical protein ONS95_002209 [Cadophora gregata]|uniref:uncharacterized protein n=1 Tax=Cadophora gregata TaxID=51156 RepID=UPI0026DDB89C|nr:uncharacterized protein ONS95_002209 [Cadophora gregata]KAK0109520.1 hypothetical protein ONS95_002209 [Cadophora gregata]
MRYSVASCVVLASALTNASLLNKRADCEAQANACRTAPEANQSFCSAQLVACLGYNPYANNTATATSSSYTPRESCQAAADQCRVKPGANQSTCSAELAACLGYNPYESKPAYTTETTYVATKDEVLTITDCPCTITQPVNPSSTPTSAPVDCQQQANECRTKPGANQSTCSAQLAQCLGYNPYTIPAQTTEPAATATGTQVQFTGAASLHKPAAGLLAVGVAALAFL